MYTGEQDITAAEIRKVFSENDNHITSGTVVTVCYDFPESVLVPGKFHQSSLNSEALALLYGEAPECVFNNDVITSADIHNHYRIPLHVENTISARFPNATIYHSTSLQLEHWERNRSIILYHIAGAN